MKKIIIKIITIVIVFILGIASMSYVYNKGNLDMTAHMAEASLPVLYFEENGEYINPSYGYTGKMDAACLRSPILPIDGERIVSIALEKYNAEIKSVSYEVRSIDMERLIQNGTVENTQKDGPYIKGSLKIKDLLEDGEEYALIFHVELNDHSDVQYFARIANSSETLVSACRNFAEDFHYATLDKNNDYPITQYLESDNAKQENSLAHVTIRSKYKNVIWGNMNVKETKKPVTTYLELEDDVLALKFDYEVTDTAEAGGQYEVTDYFRVRRTEARMYLLDYERTVEKLFFNDGPAFAEKSLNFGIQWKDIPYMANEEGSVVNFVISGELWSFDIAQNKLSKVFSFKNGSDRRGLHEEFRIQLINMEDSGSMDFAVIGYMNRGKHEGETGTLLMRYDSLTKTSEELLFIESTQCYGVLDTAVGELSYISHDDKMYLSYGTEIYTIDLNTKLADILTENVSSENCLISRDGDMLAWQHGDDEYQSSKITTMDMKSGVRHTYTGGEGEYLKPLGFIGDDFIYGIAAEADIVEDFSGNMLFPMNRVEIVDEKGELIRNFDYLSKNKYVVSASVEDNRINLQCITKNSDGTYSEALSEPITSNEEEKASTIILTAKKDEVRQTEYVLTFETEAQGKRKNIVPKQVLFEDNRTISLEEKTQNLFHVYARGETAGVYREVKNAVAEAYERMGVVTDSSGQVIWKRGSRRTRVILDAAETAEPVEAADSLEAALKFLLEEEGKYGDVKTALDNGKSAYRILKQYSERTPESFTGCSLSAMLYYINEGRCVLVRTGERSAELLVGYDAQNVYILEPFTGTVRKEGLADAAEKYEFSGNVFLSFLK